MKTNTKIEIGLLAFSVLLSLIFQVYLRSNLQEKSFITEELTGNIISKDFTIESFDHLELSTGAQIIIKPGAPKIQIEADESMIEHFELDSENKRVSLDYKGMKTKRNALATITIFTDIPLKKLSAASSDQIQYQIQDTLSNFTLMLNNATRFDGILQADSLYITGNDASLGQISGRAMWTHMNLQSASNLEMRGFQTAYLKLNMKDASQVEINVLDFIEVNSFGASRANIIGSPRVKSMNQRDASNINFHE